MCKHSTSPPRPKSRPCTICRRWFTPSPKLKARQRACGPECSAQLRKRQQADWHQRNPGYAAQRRADVAAAKLNEAWSAPEREAKAGRILGPAPPFYDRVPWDIAKTSMGAEGLVLMAYFGRLATQHAKTAMDAYHRDYKAEIEALRRDIAKTPIASSSELREAPD